MTVAEGVAGYTSVTRSRARTRTRDGMIDTMRGVAILMVIGIHSLPRIEGSALVTAVDAVLRPCVPVFLFASGYLTAQSGTIPLAKRIVRTLVPYTIAFAAAYAFMALTNPQMDQRLVVTAVRYVLAYVFVYYYVFEPLLLDAARDTGADIRFEHVFESAVAGVVVLWTLLSLPAVRISIAMTYTASQVKPHVVCTYPPPLGAFPIGKLRRSGDSQRCQAGSP